MYGEAFIEEVKDLLAASQGAADRKAEALEAAEALGRELEKLPPGAKWGLFARGLFKAWIKNGGYLLRPASRLESMKRTMLRSNSEIANEFDLTSDKTIESRQVLVSEWRQQRINRAVHEIEHGMNLQDALAMVCARDEWEEVNRRVSGVTG